MQTFLTKDGEEILMVRLLTLFVFYGFLLDKNVQDLFIWKRKNNIGIYFFIIFMHRPWLLLLNIILLKNLLLHPICPFSFSVIIVYFVSPLFTHSSFSYFFYFCQFLRFLLFISFVLACLFLILFPSFTFSSFLPPISFFVFALLCFLPFLFFVHFIVLFHSSPVFSYFLLQFSSYPLFSFY